MRLISVLLVSLLAFAPPALSAEVATGSAQVVDGDTLIVGGTKIRLFGVDAPELSQHCISGGGEWACGTEAKRQLESLIGSAQLRCSGQEADEYGRLVASCSAGGADVGEALVASGWALAYRNFSEVYVPDETRARAAKLGIWNSAFQEPSEYRNGINRSDDTSNAAPSLATAPRSLSPERGRCVIKGNHSYKGEWIYHLPGQRYYDATRPERIFCTEQQAIAAGYRRSKV